MIKMVQISGLVPVEATLVSGVNMLDFTANRFYAEHQLSGAGITFAVNETGNIPGNRITCIITGNGESTITLPAACKVVQGSFSSGNGTKNLIEFQYFSSIIITKFYQIP
jgi:hypothetical protein